MLQEESAADLSWPLARNGSAVRKGRLQRPDITRAGKTIRFCARPSASSGGVGWPRNRVSIERWAWLALREPVTFSDALCRTPKNSPPKTIARRITSSPRQGKTRLCCMHLIGRKTPARGEDSRRCYDQLHREAFDDFPGARDGTSSSPLK